MISSPHNRRSLKRRWAIAIFALLAVISVAAGWGYWATRDEQVDYAALLDEGPAVTIDAATEARIRAFCGDCHAVPRPESFHRDAWYDEVKKGFAFYAKSGRNDLSPPPLNVVVQYYRSRAPERLEFPDPPEAEKPYGVSFRQERIALGPEAKTAPAIAGLRWTRLRPDEPQVIVASDMISGAVTALDPRDPKRAVRRLAQLNNACHIEPCDLDRDGNLDLLVTDLGSFQAMDHDRGRVVWLRQDKAAGKFVPIELITGLGRVADARPLDVDGDGDLDVVVAEFGWNRTGRILLLRNIAGPGQFPRFESEELDPRTGTIHVPVCDLNGDGRPDFIALISNESECVEAFYNQGSQGGQGSQGSQGGGQFRRETLWSAPDLTFGSSGIELVDLDGDGDLDVLYVNGDAYDNSYVSPWHGVGWLENLGKGKFEYHRLTEMPGAHVVMAGDFDGDGDLDIVVVSMVPKALKPDTIANKQLASVVLLEQVSRGRFVHHTLERGFPCHASLVVGDFNGDGRLDFAVGTHNAGKSSETFGRNWLTIWWNEGPGRKR